MKTLFIEAQKKASLDIESLQELSRALPSTIYIVYIIQYKKLAEKIKKELQKSKKIAGFSQVLGCSKIKANAEAVLLVGSSRFHATNLACSSNKEVYIFPGAEKITKTEIQEAKAKEKAKYVKFLSADKVGIIVSTKQGQQNLPLALSLKEKLKKQDKKVFLFLADSINIAELENFHIPIWLNTACPGLALDSSKIMNYNSIKHSTK